MTSNPLTYQLAQMALENQYDRSAFYVSKPAPQVDHTDYPEDLIFFEATEDFPSSEDPETWPPAGSNVAYELDQTKALYTFHLLIARLVFRNDTQADQTLRLSGKRAESLAGWTAQATDFYADLGYLSAAMIQYGITLPQLRQAKAMVEAVVDYYV